MHMNWTSKWKVMTILISRELPLLNFESLDILCARIESLSEKLWPFELLQSFHCWISSVSIYYAPESDLRVKSYDHLNFSRASVVEFRASRYIMCLNRTSEGKVMTIWIAPELPLLNFERLDILCAWIGSPSKKLWPFEFLESFRCSITRVSIYYAPESDLRVKSYDHLNFSRVVAQFREPRYIMRLNRTSDWKVMTIWISRELLVLNFEHLDILCAWVEPPSEKLWPLDLLQSFHCWISSVSIYYAPESDLRVKSYDHLNFSRASGSQFRAPRYIMRLNRTSEWKLMTIWIARKLPLLNFEHLDILCAWIESPSEKLRPFELLQSFHCWISSVSIYYAQESDLWVKSYDHFNFSRASVAQFLAPRYIMRLNRTSKLKVMTIWISRELPLFNLECLDIMRLNRISEWEVMTIWISRVLPLFNYERLDILCAWIGPPS